MFQRQLYRSINERGYGVISSLLSPDLCKSLMNAYNDSTLYRKTIDMQRYRFGQGEYKYFNTRCRKCFNI